MAPSSLPTSPRSAQKPPHPIVAKLRWISARATPELVAVGLALFFLVFAVLFGALRFRVVNPGEGNMCTSYQLRRTDTDGVEPLIPGEALPKAEEILREMLDKPMRFVTANGGYLASKAGGSLHVVRDPETPGYHTIFALQNAVGGKGRLAIQTQQRTIARVRQDDTGAWRIHHSDSAERVGDSSWLITRAGNDEGKWIVKSLAKDSYVRISEPNEEQEENDAPDGEGSSTGGAAPTGVIGDVHLHGNVGMAEKFELVLL
jgi:hypothetical protein